MERKLANGMVIVLITNLITIMFNIVTNFLLPKYLSIDSYSAIKTFQLYTNFVGVFALGYSDGMYLEYGGKSLTDIDLKILKVSVSTLKILMIFESVVFVIISCVIKNNILLAFSLTIFTQNVIGYYKNLYQAVGEFKRYGIILNLTTAFTFIINVFLLFIIKTDYYFWYLLGYAFIYVIIWLILEYRTRNLYCDIKTTEIFSTKMLVDYIRLGFFLLVGNFSSILFTSMDRWFVKGLMDNYSFAEYSFAVTMENFLVIAISPLTITLYNYFCNKNDKETISNFRKYILLFSSYLISVAYILSIIIRLYLPKYTGSIDIIYILFVAQVFFVPNKAIYVNLYKAKGLQRQYFTKLVFTLIVGACLNTVFYMMIHNTSMFAYATFLSAFVWIVLSIYDFREYSIEFREIFYCVTIILLFWGAGKLVADYWALIIYLGVVILFSLTLMRKEFKVLIRDGVNIVRERINRLH